MYRSLFVFHVAASLALLAGCSTMEHQSRQAPDWRLEQTFQEPFPIIYWAAVDVLKERRGWHYLEFPDSSLIVFDIHSIVEKVEPKEVRPRFDTGDTPNWENALDDRPNLLPLRSTETPTIRTESGPVEPGAVDPGPVQGRSRTIPAASAIALRFVDLDLLGTRIVLEAVYRDEAESAWPFDAENSAEAWIPVYEERKVRCWEERFLLKKIEEKINSSVTKRPAPIEGPAREFAY